LSREEKIGIVEFLAVRIEEMRAEGLLNIVGAVRDEHEANVVVVDVEFVD